MSPYSRLYFNKDHHYILILSKYTWVVLLKSKGESETAEIIRANGKCPKNLQTNMRKRLQHRCEENLKKKHNVNRYSMYSTLKALVVERFNRTLKNDMWKMFTLNGNYKWVNKLSHFVSDYNTRKHRHATRRSPKWIVWTHILIINLYITLDEHNHIMSVSNSNLRVCFSMAFHVKPNKV